MAADANTLGADIRFAAFDLRLEPVRAFAAFLRTRFRHHSLVLNPPRNTPGRGAAANPANRFEKLHLEPDPDAESEARADAPAAPRTQFFKDHACSILTHNDSPDIGYDTSLNAYRGCEHGCSYCYAGPQSAI